MFRKLLSFLSLPGQPSQASVVAFGVWLACTPGASPELARRISSQDLVPGRAGAGAAPFASLERSERAGGGELLCGETELELPGALRSVHVSETAELDASGRLVLAEVELSYVARAPATLPGNLVEHATFDSAHQSVRTVLHDGRTDVRHVDGSFPWIYLPVTLPSGATFSTPVAVSVARSAAHAGAFALRVSAPGTAVSISADQFAIPGDAEDWVVLGDDLATFSRDKLGRPELSRLKVANLKLELRPQGPQSTPLG